jgi:hypothetical protein
MLTVALAAAWAIQGEKSLDGSICIGSALYCTSAPPWPLKWPATEVHRFDAAAYFD